MPVKIRMKFRSGLLKRSEIEIECDSATDLAEIKKHITYNSKI